MIRHPDSICSESSGPSRSSSASYNRYDDDYHDDSVAPHVDRINSFDTRSFAHMLRGPLAAKKDKRRKDRSHRHHMSSSSSTATSSAGIGAPSPAPAPGASRDQYGQQRHWQLQQPGPSPPPPGMMRPGFGSGDQSFPQMSVPPMDHIWGVPQQQQQQQQQLIARRTFPPYSRSPDVVLGD